VIGVVASPDGKNLCRSEIFGSVNEAAELGKRLAEQLLERGAGELLASI
jgi:hydroxymethylbilane synthase